MTVLRFEFADFAIGQFLRGSACHSSGMSSPLTSIGNDLPAIFFIRFGTIFNSLSASSTEALRYPSSASSMTHAPAELASISRGHGLRRRVLTTRRPPLTNWTRPLIYYNSPVIP